MFYAHSTEDPSCRDWHKLDEHLNSVGDLAAQFGSSFGVAKAARLAGVLHDLGKYTPAFQARLRDSTERVDHSTVGAAEVRNQASDGDSARIAELIAYGIAGHHAGLPDSIGGPSSLQERLKLYEADGLDPVWRTEITPDGSQLTPDFKWQLSDKSFTAFQLGFLGRMIFSCLVDADFKDTEQYLNRVEDKKADREWPPLQAILPTLLTAFNQHMTGLRKIDTRVNRLRSKILDHVQGQANKPTGLFALTVPTGGGKTLASLAFALNHAQEHRLNRIIYAIPYTSIIDQTVDVFRTVLGNDYILEHHSAIDEETFSSKEAREGKNKLKLAMEDWAAPIVVTTNAQLFESLFAARPSRCRKLHNIANSIIILDEAQTLPRRLLAPSVRVLDELARNYSCKIVLCTATQPALDKRNFPDSHPMGLPLEGRELAPAPKRLAEELRRTTIKRVGDMSNDDLLAALRDHAQGLVILNSRKHALDLFNQAKESELESIIHLTTRQYAAHRREILRTVRQRLASGKPCRLVATSLVEASVDLDFPRVWRAETGLDQIAQAAGRCNREGRHPAEGSIVTVFAAPDYKPPAEIKQMAAAFDHMMRDYQDLLSPVAMEAFFAEVYWQMGKALDAEDILECFRVDGTGTNFAYRTVAEKYCMIESGMQPLIVVRDATAETTLRWLRSGVPRAGALARRFQPYVVQVPPNDRTLLISNGHVHFEREDVYGNQFAVLQTADLYAEETGLSWEEADYLGGGATII